MVVGRVPSATRPSALTPARVSSWVRRSAAGSVPTTPTISALAVQGGDVGRDVAGSADLESLRPDGHHRDGGLRGDAGNRPPDVLVQHHVAEHEDAASWETPQILLQLFRWFHAVNPFQNAGYAIVFLAGSQPPSPAAVRRLATPGEQNTTRRQRASPCRRCTGDLGDRPTGLCRARKYASVSRSPASRATVRLPARAGLCARVMSGWRTRGSSWGRGA